MNIYSFIKTLNTTEQKIIENVFVQKRVSSGHKTKNAEYQLFDFVFKSQLPIAQLTDELTFNHLNRWENIQALQKSKSRLLSIIFDVACRDEYIHHEDITADVERAEIKTKKKLLTCKILYTKKTRNNHEVLLHLLSEVESASKEYELYDNLCEVYSYRKLFSSTKALTKEYEEACLAYQQYRELSELKSDIIYFHHKFTRSLNLSSPQSRSNLLLELNEMLQRVESSKVANQSARILYFYYLLKFSQSELNRQFDECINFCLDCLSLLRSNPFLSRNERRGMVYGNLANSHIYQRNFKKAARAARIGEREFPVGTVNYVLIVEQEFLATFYDKDFRRADECMELMLKYTLGDSGQFRKDKYIYYKGWLEFVQGNYKEARKISQKKLLISEDKTGWDIGIRYLNILSLIMLSEFKTAKNAIVALKKQIARLLEAQESAAAKAIADDSEALVNGKKKITERDIEIANALHELAKEDFRLKSATLNYKLIKLGDKESKLVWQLFSHELVPVNRWIRAYLNEYGGNKLLLEAENSNF